LLALKFNPAGFVVFPAFVLQAVIGGTTELGLAQFVTRIRVSRYSDVAVAVALLTVWLLRLDGLISTP
jgi:hypothetical protein